MKTIKRMILPLLLLMMSSLCVAQDFNTLPEQFIQYFDAGQYEKAIEVLQQLLEIQKKTLVEDDSDYASSLSILGFCYYSLGDYVRAIEFYSQALEIQKKVLGEEHSNYTMSLNSLGLCYSELGNYSKAIELHTQALEIQKKVLGEEHSDVATWLNVLGLCYSKLGDHSNAIELHTQALEIQKKTLGQEHPDVAASLNNLGSCYSKLGNYSKAIEQHAQALEIQKKTLGQEHPDVAASLNNLGSYYSDLGDYSKAVELHEQALEIQKKVLGEEYSDVAAWLDNLGSCYSKLGNYSKAIEQHAQALEIQKKTLGQEHPDVAASLNSLGLCYLELGDYSKAIELHTQALEIWKKTLGEEHSYIAASLNNLGNCYYSLGDYAKAIEIFTQALKIQKKTLGQEHPDVAASLNNLGSCYSDLGNYSKAIELHEQALEIQKKTLGQEHPDYIGSLKNLGVCYHSLGDYVKAIEIFTQALKIQKKTLGQEHPDVAASLNNLGVCYHSVGDYSKALKLHEQALEIQKKTLGQEHPDYARSLINLGVCYFDLGNYAKAIGFCRESVNVKYSHLLNTFGRLTTAKRAAYWDRYSSDFHEWYPRFICAFDDTTSLGDLYDKSCLFAKGLLLATEMEMRDLVRESGDPVAQEKFDRLQGIRSVLNQQYTKPKEERLPNIKTMEDEAERLEQELMGTVSAYGDLMRNLKLTWRDVRSKLGESDVAVEFLSFPVAGDTTQYIALTVRKGYASPHLVDLFTSTELDDVRNEAYTDKGLSRLVWGRMATELEGVKNIYFSPSGELHNIGIESVPHWSDDCLMSDRFDLYRLSSTRELAMARNVVSSRGAMVYGGIKFNTSVPTMVSKSGKVGDEAHSMSDIYAMHVLKDRLVRNLQESRDWKINDLPGTMTEAESVHKQLKSKLKKQDVVLLTGSDATEESFKRLSGNRDRVIHIATHGMYLKADHASDNRRKQQLSFLFHDGAGQGLTEDESLSRSCLLFSGARNTFNGADVKVPDSIDDGVLTAQEVSRLDLRGLDLLVLSACQTGLGDVTADGVMGLQRGFKKAGAQSIVMSLWSVDDAATRDMMEQFYKQLKPDMSNKREAFLNAQQDVRKNDGQYKYSDNPEIDARLRKARPHWAAFILLDALK